MVDHACGPRRNAGAVMGCGQVDVMYLRMARMEGKERGANLIRMEAIKLIDRRGRVTQVCPLRTKNLIYS